ncbi:hypothetical protein AVL55_05020 [Alteromonas macleodii]|uniref:Glycosyltransferase 2-like domain-containing protein n=1 Tax=Alteromonas macleodii TaxID=28108 RepID=A0A126PX12_ALTMA|nr:glycosyltransferase family A protein [Alteromonas macleodii]AMJ97577.1 hypothetical protein AVL55_05020 [Alteromonas macleodii]
MTWLTSPLVTIIIPCYGQVAYLYRAIESCIAQTYSQLEILIVDDGNQKPISEHHFPPDSRIKLFRQSNLGLSAARNKGIAEASGQLIKFLDADDWLLPDCIATQVSSVGHSTDTVSVIGYYLAKESEVRAQPVIPKFGDFFTALASINIGPPHCFLYPSRLVHQVEGFSTAEKVRGGHEDYDFNLRVALQGARVVTCHSVGCYYFVHADSMSTRAENMRVSRASVLRDLLEYYQRQDAFELDLPWLVHALAGALKFDFYPLLKHALLAQVSKDTLSWPATLGKIEQEELLWLLLRCRATILNYDDEQFMLDWLESQLQRLAAIHQRTTRYPTAQNIVSACYPLKPFAYDDTLVMNVVQQAKTVLAPKKLLLWGDGERFQRWRDWLMLTTDTELLGTTTHLSETVEKQGVRFVPFNEIDFSEIDKVLICSDVYYWDILSLLRSMGWHAKVIDLYATLQF